MGKTSTGQSASTWRKADKAYRKEQNRLRKANRERKMKLRGHKEGVRADDT